MRAREFHVIRGRGAGPIYVDPALDPLALTEVVPTLKPGDQVRAGPAPAWWERLMPWKAREVRALERIAAALELYQDRGAV